jgi:hypothetical protein
VAGAKELNMNSTYLLFTIAAAILVAGAAVLLTGAARVFFRYRGKMLFTCPETGKAACVKVAASDAARTSLTGRPKIRLSECSRWPERQNCGQECLSQIGADPENCLIWTKVADWYRGRTCIYCRKILGELHWHDHKPALVGMDGKTVQWNEVAHEKLPELFETHLPVCWNCHVAETFRREFPERVVERPGNRGPMGEWLANHKEHRANTALAARS